MSPELLVALLGVLAALVPLTPLLFAWYHRKRGRFVQEYKFTYVKVVHLTRRGPGAAPVYRAHVSRIAQDVDVYDEFHVFRLNIFRRPQAAFHSRDRSSGVVDLQILHPWSEDGRLVFSDRDESLLPGLVTQTIRKRSNVFFTKSISYNGLQTGHQDLAMKLEHDTRDARMVVDFSSIPDCARLVPVPTAVECLGGVETHVSARRLAPGIFSASLRDASAETVLRMDFAFAWDAVQPPPPPSRRRKRGAPQPDAGG